MGHPIITRSSLPLLLLTICLLLLIVGCDKSDNPTYNVHIAVVDQFESRVISGNTVEIYALNPDGSIDKKMISSAVTDEKGVAHLSLPKGVYRATPAGSWAGSTDFSLSLDTQELKTTIYVQSILN